MKKSTLFWITGIVLAAALLLFVPSMLMFGRSGWMHDSGYNMMEGYSNVGPGSSMMGDYGYGMLGGNMMGGGWMAFGWLIPIAILILVIAAGVWLGNALSNRSRISSSAPAQSCSNCSKAVDADWSTCPFCGTSLR